MDPFSAASAATIAKKTQEAAKIGWKLWKWYKYIRYPKAGKNAIGIVVAIRPETEQVYNQIQNDFIPSLIKLAASGDAKRPIEIIQLPVQHLEKVKDHESAEKALDKCRGRLIIWGQAKKRSINDKEFTVVEMNALVYHNLIFSNVSDAFRSEMRELLPERLLVSKGNDLVEMELNAHGVDLASHYFVALGAFLSEEKEYSLQLFRTLENKLSFYDISTLPEGLRSHIVLLKKKVTASIALIFMEFATKEHVKWRKTRENKYLESYYDYTLKADAIFPGLYNTALATSFYLFVVKNDVKRAIKVLEPWKANASDATWAFNMAFLYAYEGHLARASHYYRIASRRSTDSRVMLEVEEFLEWILEKYPEKYQLHYLLGMMQFFERGEIDLGSGHFRKFLDSVPAGEFKTQVQEVAKYLDPSYKKSKKMT